IKSQVDRTDGRMTGVGDAIVGLQVVAFKRTGYPTFAFAHHSKLPTASKEKKLGNGRVDHKAVLLISDQLGGLNLNINAAYLNGGERIAAAALTEDSSPSHSLTDSKTTLACSENCRVRVWNFRCRAASTRSAE